MPTRTTDNPFTPRGSLSRGTLERYVRGDLSPAERHAVELRIEADPLLREAIDGLGAPGAMAGLKTLRNARPATARAGSRYWVIAGVSVIAVAGAIWSTRTSAPVPDPAVAVPAPDRSIVPVTPAQQAEFTREVAQATALPESLMSAFRGADHFVVPMDTTGPAVREAPPAHVDARPAEPVQAPPMEVEKPKEAIAPKPSRQLLFFFDMKLVHPKELYPIDPVLELANGSVDARFSDAEAEANARSGDHAVPYDRFFKAALGKFARGDRQGCLEELFIVLEEYPEDVNALFYAGLCCYDLGLFPRAADLLERAWHHPVDTFQEEAEWYHALAVERSSGRERSRSLLQAVADRGGFYALRARAHLAGK